MSDFWARRRAAVAAEVEAEEAALRADERAELEAAQAEKSDEELLQDLGLPDPDTLGEGDDIKAFLSDAVPARLKTRALRQLWRVNPVLANLDGLLDYGEDFTDAATVIENLQTAYQVGKGMTAHVEELARQAEAALGEDGPADDSEDAAFDAAPEVADATDAAGPAAPEGGPGTTAFTEAETRAETREHHVPQDEPSSAPPRRRMRIVFDPDQEETA